MTFEIVKSLNPNLGESFIIIRGFRIKTRKKAISNAVELVKVENELGIPSLPEMFYGSFIRNLIL
jgi:hypothetical protein